MIKLLNPKFFNDLAVAPIFFLFVVELKQNHIYFSWIFAGAFSLNNLYSKLSINA